MDADAAELLNHHQGSLELAQREKDLNAHGANLPPGTTSSNGAIEHVGEGVQAGRTDLPDEGRQTGRPRLAREPPHDHKC